MCLRFAHVTLRLNPAATPEETRGGENGIFVKFSTFRATSVKFRWQAAQVMKGGYKRNRAMQDAEGVPPLPQLRVSNVRIGLCTNQGAETFMDV